MYLVGPFIAEKYGETDFLYVFNIGFLASLFSAEQYSAVTSSCGQPRTQEQWRGRGQRQGQAAVAKSER